MSEKVPKVKQNLARDILYLEQNLTPMEPSGLKLEKLDYEGSSDDEEERLDDDHIQ